MDTTEIKTKIKASEQGDLAKKARINANLIQSDLAQKMGLTSPQHVSNVERGISPLGITYANHLIKNKMVSRDEVIRVLSKEYSSDLDSKIIGE